MKLVLSNIQGKLLEFVIAQHGEQKRKYTFEPYWTHVLSVAEIVAVYEPRGIEIALCHDLFEDTSCDFDRLYNKMIAIGYAPEHSYDTCTCVKKLTDVFTKEAYPYLNRLKRKENEAKRLGQISSISQSVKYADLIDNTGSITEHDKGFAKKYLQEKIQTLDQMRTGNIHLLIDCCSTLKNALKLVES